MVLLWANHSYWSTAEARRAADHPSPQAIADITSFSAGFMLKHVWSVGADQYAAGPTLSTAVVPVGGDPNVAGTQVSAVLLGEAQTLGLVSNFIHCAEVSCTTYAMPCPPTRFGALSRFYALSALYLSILLRRPGAPHRQTFALNS
jgi:hypothetical protein